MVTLTGTAGVGKSRLALQIGEILLDDFGDGVCFISLSSLADPALILTAVAEGLAIKESGRDLLETVSEQIKEKHLLLVMDNYEHLLGGAWVVAELLDRCRNLHMLITSQVPLHLSRENEYAVQPLMVPDPKRLPNVSILERCEAVSLFIERARAVKREFTLTGDNARAVAEICVRLDGLPLAIELAAARVKLLPPQALLRRLDSRLRLLTGGPRDLPARHQTLRAAIDWSHSMLSAEEQRLLPRISVFSVGCSVESAEAICNPGEALDILACITSLVDKSLLLQEGTEEPRLRLLETIREYAGEKLAASGEAELIAEAHARFFLALAEEAESQLSGPRQAEWVTRLDSELDNLREAMRWFLSRSRPEEELRLAVAVFLFWRIHGHWAEAQRWLTQGLGKAETIDLGLRASVLSVLGMFLWMREELEESIVVLTRAVEMASAAGDYQTRAHALNRLGVVHADQREFEQASTGFDESLRLARELGMFELQGIVLNNLGALAGNQEDVKTASRRYQEALIIYTGLEMTNSMCLTQINLGWIALREGNLEEAETWFHESLIAAEELNDGGRMVAAFDGKGRAALQSGRLDEAERYFQESLRLAKQLNAKRGIATALVNLGDVSRRTGRLDGARDTLRAGLELARELAHVEDELEALDCMTSLAYDEGRHDRAVRLKAAELAERERAHVAPDLLVARSGQALCQRLRVSLGDAAFSQAWTQGESMSLEEALAYALGAEAD
jgi:predicted ATPase/Tfp pilus assembly protein PilF